MITTAMQRPSISVVVPHYADLVGLSACLDCLVGQSLTPMEIIVADNASPEGEAEVSAVIAGRARLVVVAEKGAGPARNGGAAAAHGDILAFTDSDCRPEPDWLQGGLGALQGADIAGGRMRVLTPHDRSLSGAEAFEAVFGFDNAAYVRKKGFSVSANLFVPRRVFEAVGGFAAAGVSEDVDWCRRAARLGFNLAYAPDAVVWHPARDDWEQLLRKWRRIETETFGLARQEGGSPVAWLLSALAMPLSAVFHTPKALASGTGLNLVERLRGLVVLHRLRAWRMVYRLGLLRAKARQ